MDIVPAWRRDRVKSMVENVLRKREKGCHGDSFAPGSLRDHAFELFGVTGSAGLSGFPAVERLGGEIAARIKQRKLPGPGKDSGDVRTTQDAPEDGITGGCLLNLVLGQRCSDIPTGRNEARGEENSAGGAIEKGTQSALFPGCAPGVCDEARWRYSRPA